jgi:hypothetical protein
VLLAYMLVLTIAELGPWLEVRLLFDPDRPEWVTPVFFIVALSNLLIWPLWCNLANLTLQSAAHPPLKNRPIMAAAWFVIPGAFLLMPWLVIREIYLASEHPSDWEDRKAPIVGWWWCLRLVSYFGLWPSLLLDPREATRGQLILQLIIIAEMGVQIFLSSRMSRWLARPLNVTAAEVF